MPNTKQKYVVINLVALIVGFSLLAVVVVLSFALVRHQQNAQRAVVSAVGSMAEAHQLFSALQDAETGQRGYLLTGAAPYLDPYEAAVKQIDEKAERLGSGLAGDSVGQQIVVTLRQIAHEKIEEMARTIDRRRVGDVEGALEVVRTDEGKRRMDQARSARDRLLSHLSAQIAARQSDVDNARARLLQAIVAAAVLVVLVAGATFIISFRQTAAVIHSRDQLSAANRRLVEEAVEREHLEAKLRQSQKMEAVGQLTGGLAHDFNNMLAIITGSIGMAQRRLKRGDTAIEPFLGNAMEGAERATTLTHRLLAFSRQQPLAPQPIDPNKFVSGLAELLRRTLGEHVQLETVMGAGLWRTHADPSQLENAILNLAVNARDAMADGGKLTIETQNADLDAKYARSHEVPEGQYVLIAVTDTGSGMPVDVMAKVFDPFFTTKPVGKGTGLGLSQVYGFVKQSQGHIKVYSEPEQGTTVKIYLPRFYGEGPVEEPVLEGPMPLGSAVQVVLVVEDEEGVRRLSVESLQELGYTVLEANGAAAALRAIDERGDIALLFTDIVMPEVNGRKLADEALRRRPELKVLYTTGYTRNAIVHNGVLDPGTHLLTKPFTLDQLARKVDEVLS